jgi:hypothetical protein
VVGFWLGIGIFGGMVMMSVSMMVMTMPVSMMIMVIMTMAVIVIMSVSMTLGFCHQTEFTTFAVHIHLTQLGFNFPFPSEF